MNSLRKWLYRPKKDDTSLLAQFFYADEELNVIAGELDSFDGRKDPERCTTLVNHLRQCQDKVLNICNMIMDEVIPAERANRDFRVKFPDDVLQENLAGQLWFGAECLAAGSSIMNREVESASMRPLAKALTKSLENVRNLLREQCFRNQPEFTEKIRECLKIFDRLFAEFELSYVSAMVPVKTMKEYDMQQSVVVLFSETLQRALKMELLTQELVDDYDPALMFTIPRLAIVCGLLTYPDGPLNIDQDAAEMSEMFRPFKTLLCKIRELLWTLSKNELSDLQKSLCSMEEPRPTPETNRETSSASIMNLDNYPVPDMDDFVSKFCTDYPSCKQFITDFYSCTFDNNRGEGSSRQVESAEEALMSPATFEEDDDDTVVEELRSGGRSSFLSIGCSCDSALDASTPTSDERIDDDIDCCNLCASTAVDETSALLTDETNYCDTKTEAMEIPDDGERNYHCSDKVDIPAPALNLQADTECGSSVSSACSSCRSTSTMASEDSISQCSSSDTSSYNSECQDDEEIALAMQAAEIATRNEARAKFKSSEDLIHRLFVCISGVADQLQTNYASDLRNILKCVFAINATPAPKSITVDEDKTNSSPFSLLLPTTPVTSPIMDDSDSDSLLQQLENEDSLGGSPTGSVDRADDALNPQEGLEQPPAWVPDQLAPQCMACNTQFTMVRRRHHCRNCGKVFCARCSSNSVALPHYGHLKPVRVCNRCFMYQVTPFTFEEVVHS